MSARLVDTATLAVWLGTTPREVRRQAADGTLVVARRSSGGRRGRPGLWFDLDNLRGELTAGGPAVNDVYGGVLCATAVTDGAPR